jgi:hypothetical protein
MKDRLWLWLYLVFVLFLISGVGIGAVYLLHGFTDPNGGRKSVSEIDRVILLIQDEEAAMSARISAIREVFDKNEDEYIERLGQVLEHRYDSVALEIILGLERRCDEIL